MARRLGLATVVLVISATALLAEDDLPKQDQDDSFEIEPPLLIPYQDSEPGSISASPAPALDLEQLERNLERAKRSAGNAEHLFKIGVLAKVEAEQRALRVVCLQSDLENARLAHAKEEFALQEKSLSAGEISKEDFKQAETALAHAISVAHAAAADRKQAEIAAAELNLSRERKLLDLGSARKSEVARAEQKLAELKAQKN